jgi:VanZ family protein
MTISQWRATTMGTGTNWSVWLACLAVWTVGLLTPEPVQVGQEVLPAGTAFPLAKTLHVSAYAGLTLLAAWLRLPLRRRWLLPAALGLHGAATEWLQNFVPPRDGSLRDVALDVAGITLGLLFTRRWWFGAPSHRPAGD